MNLSLEKNQDACAGQQVEFISATVNYTTNITLTNNVPAFVSDDGQISIEAFIPKSAQGTNVSTVITLTNRKGSTNSEPKLTSEQIVLS